MGAKILLFLKFYFLLLLVSIPTQAAPSLPLQEFLALPVYDLEWSSQPNSVHVGDFLYFKLQPTQNTPLPPANELQLEFFQPQDLVPTPSPSPHSDTKPTSLLQQEGWEMRTSTDGFIAIPLKPGKLTLPSLLVTYSRSGTSPTQSQAFARTNPITLEVSSNLSVTNNPKAQEPAPLRGPLRVTFPQWALWLGIFLGILFLSLCIYLLYRWIRKQKKSELFSPPPVPPKPEDEVALLALESIEKQNLIQNGLYKKHYFGISEILKNYFGTRYDFDAPERTSGEILQHFENQIRLSLPLLLKIKELFDHMDLIKFTDTIPQEEEAKNTLQQARQLIQQTKRPAPTLLPPTPQTHPGGKPS